MWFIGVRVGVTLLALVVTCSSTDICGLYPPEDPCRPGGLWDPVTRRCSGYMALGCFQCYSGPLCQTQEDPLQCQLRATAGNPMVVAEYWLNHSKQEPCDTTPAYYRPAYQRSADASSLPTFILPPLEEVIRELHAVTHNAKTDGHVMVGGMGATMVIHATIIALSEQILQNCTVNCPSKVDVLVQSPYYSGYPSIVGLVGTAQWNSTADPASPYTIEILTDPNNPNGERRSPRVQDPSHVIRDMVYYWPMYTTLNESLSEPIMVFSSSKHEGLAGSRFGWGLFRDAGLAHKVSAAVDTLVLGLSVDAELRVLSSLQAILSEVPSPSGLLPFHEFSQQLLLQRFKQLAAVLTCATLTNWPSSSHGAYAWVKCAEGTDCRELFLKVNLYTLSGQEFGATSQYARLDMLLPSIEFSVLVKKVEALCGGRKDL